MSVFRSSETTTDFFSVYYELGKVRALVVNWWPG